MRKLLTLLFTISIISLVGQSYIPIPASSTSEWRVFTSHHYKKNPCIINNDFRYFFNGDTIINSTTYSKLYKTGIWYLWGQNCDPTHNHYENSYIGAIRNDTGKVFYIANTLSNEILIYDFTLNIGDIPPYDFFVINNPQIISIDTIIINNKQHRRFFIDSVGSATFDSSYYIVEGIGNGNGLLEVSHWESTAALLCYAENHIPIFPVGSNCILNIGIEEVFEDENNIDISLFPNPANSQITFEFNKASKEQLFVSIFNAQGQEVRAIEFESGINSQNVDISDLSSGVYFYRVNSEKFDKQFSGTFLKK